MKLTKKRTIILHRKLWNWIADNPDKKKGEWPDWIYFDDEIKNCCFLCEYVDSCSECLLDWEVTDRCNGDSYYVLYLKSNNEQDRSKYARIIANLKER